MKSLQLRGKVELHMVEACWETFLEQLVTKLN